MLLGQRLDVTFVWAEGGITAPVQMWVEEILMALPADVQGKVLDEVIERVELMNEEIMKAEDERLEAVAKAEAEIAEDWDGVAGDGIEDDDEDMQESAAGYPHGDH